MFTRRIKDNILYLTFKSPSTRNALSLKAAEAFLQHALQEPIDGLVLLGEGSVFCSGGQLKDYAKNPEAGLKVNKRIFQILEDFSSLPFFKVAYVDGLCVGGGVEWLSSMDQIFCSPRSRFGLWQRKIGLSFGWGGGARLEKWIGKSQTRRWLLQTSLLSAYRCKELGFVENILMPQSFLDKIQKESFWKLKTFDGSERLWSFSANKESELFDCGTRF